MENLCLNIVYIGGNNDSITLFKKPFPSLTVKSINIHKSFLKLADDLYVIGYGGNINNYNINQLEEIFFSLYNYINENDKIKDIQIILINNDNYYENKNIKSVYQNFFEKSKNIFLNLNGNIEEKQGTYNLINTKIINPGSINEGQLGIIDLERDNKDYSWKIQNIEYLLI